MASRKKNFAVTIRMTDTLRQAIQAAAAHDTRTVTSYVEKVVVEDLKAKGYLREESSVRPVAAERKSKR